MSAAFDSSDFRRLQSLWAQWTKTISQAALPQWRRRNLTDERFAKIRQPLLRICSSLAQTTTHGKLRGLLLRMHELVEPWTTPKSLNNVDQKYLASLITECRELGRQLHGRRPQPRRLPTGIGIAWVALLVVGLIWLAGGIPGTLDVLGEGIRRGVAMLQSASFLQRFAVYTVAVVLGGIFLLNRTRRF